MKGSLTVDKTVSYWATFDWHWPSMTGGGGVIRGGRAVGVIRRGRVINYRSVILGQCPPEVTN